MARLTSNGIQFNLSNATDSINSFYWMYPAGTRKLFYQSTAPTGWTKVTNVSSGGNNLALNNVALRVVSGTGGGFGVGGNANVNTGGLFTTILSNPASGNFSLTYSGTFDIDLVPGTASIVGNRTLSLTNLPDHTHESLFGSTSGTNATPFSNAGSTFLTSGSLATGTMQESQGGGSHNHPFSGSVTFTNVVSNDSINMNVQYVDVIVCSLD